MIDFQSSNYLVLGSGSVDNWDGKKPKPSVIKKKPSEVSQGIVFNSSEVI